MEVRGDYRNDGYAHIRQLIPRELARAVLQGIKDDIGPAPIQLSQVQNHPNLLKRAAFEIYGHYYKPLLYFLWGMTPTISGIVGLELLPSYDYFRLYRKDDVCRVHSDRWSCEHSLSLTLGYSDDEVWNFQVGREAVEPSSRVEETFGQEPFSTVRMEVGDAILYQGVTRRHGRMDPNPNAWSAHLFLHWVDSKGPHREHAFDRQITPSRVAFTFA